MHFISKLLFEMYKEEPFDYEASSHYETPGSSAPQTSEVAQNEAEYNPSIYGTEKDKVSVFLKSHFRIR